MAVSDKKTKTNLIIFTVVILIVVLGLLSFILTTSLSGGPSSDDVIYMDITTDGETLEEADVPQVIDGVVPDGQTGDDEFTGDETAEDVMDLTPDEPLNEPLPADTEGTPAIYYEEDGSTTTAPAE